MRIQEVKPTPSSTSFSQSNLESEIISILKKILNNENIKVNDNFFHIGGDSLLAACLYYEIENLTGIQLPLASLIKNPTVKEIVNLINNPEKEEWNSLIPIRLSGKKKPLYCVHGIGGNIINYCNLAKYLEPNRPLYGLQARGLSSDTKPFYTICEMAKHYIKEIKKLQPVGPYYLGGYSFGGWVAMEMAYQLELNSEDVAFIALFEPRKHSWLRIELNTRPRIAYGIKKLLSLFRKSKDINDIEDKRNQSIVRLYNAYGRLKNQHSRKIYLGSQEQILETASWIAFKNYVPAK